LTIATSKYGEPFDFAMKEIAEEWTKAGDVLVVFGSPTAGLNEIIAREGLCLNDLADFTVNTLPMQGTETVRTEEAVIATLACFNATLPREGSSNL
jgi:predicted SPOUT superfamily RNA methylase MTH1